MRDMQIVGHGDNFRVLGTNEAMRLILEKGMEVTTPYSGTLISDLIDLTTARLEKLMNGD